MVLKTMEVLIQMCAHMYPPQTSISLSPTGYASLAKIFEHSERQSQNAAGSAILFVRAYSTGVLPLRLYFLILIIKIQSVRTLSHVYRDTQSPIQPLTYYGGGHQLCQQPSSACR